MTMLGVHHGNGLASVIRGKGFSRFRIDLVCYGGCRCHPSHFWLLIIVLVSIISVGSCTVQLLPSRTLDDGFDRLSVIDKNNYMSSDKNVSSFATATALRHDTYTVFGSRNSCREWRPEDVVTVARQHRLTWLMLVSSWCPHARNDVSRWQEVQHRLRRADVASVVLSTDYEVSYLTSVQSVDSAFAFVGIASVGDYHADQLEKCNRFQKILFPSCPPSAGLPRHYLLDSTGALVTWHFGELYDPGWFLNAEELE